MIRLQIPALGALFLLTQSVAGGEQAQLIPGASAAPSTSLATHTSADAYDASPVSGGSSLPWAQRPGRTGANNDGPEGEGEETESVGDMFLRCCWARGRAAFNFCHAYAACAGVGEMVCRGVGAAEGLSASCANPPARLEELEGG